MSQQSWYDKLRTSVPSWVFENKNFNEGLFQSFAKSLDSIETNFKDHLSETFIDTSEGKYLDQHGQERDIDRTTGELDPSYASRVKKIENNSNCVAIKSIVDAFLVNGESQIIEHFNVSNFYNRESFVNRDIIDVEVLFNAFTIMVNKQIPAATNFYDREVFLNREFIGGSDVSDINIFNNIVEAVNKAKAFGTVYRLIERPTE